MAEFHAFTTPAGNKVLVNLENIRWIEPGRKAGQVKLKLGVGGQRDSGTHLVVEGDVDELSELLGAA